MIRQHGPQSLSCWLYVHCSYQVRAKDLKRLCGEENCGWLNKTGLTSTRFQKRWCAIYDLKLYYFDNPRSEEPNGVVSTFRPSHARAHTDTHTHARATHRWCALTCTSCDGHIHILSLMHTHGGSNSDVVKCGKLHWVNFTLNVTIN
jgi:hypothetical protein